MPRRANNARSFSFILIFGSCFCLAEITIHFSSKRIESSLDRSTSKQILQ
jgi:hypothetical protein